MQASAEQNRPIAFARKSGIAIERVRFGGSDASAIGLFFAVVLLGLSLLWPRQIVIGGWIWGGFITIVGVLFVLMDWRRTPGLPNDAPVSSSEHWENVSPYPDPSVRVACTGAPFELARVHADGPIVDAAFEPVVAYAPAAGSLGRLGVVSAVVMTGVIGVPIGLLSYALHQSVSAVLPSVIFAALLSGKLVGHVWPSYIRVTPGRLDVLICTFLGRRIVRCRSYDLRTRAVLVDMSQNCVFLATKDATTEVLLHGTAEPVTIARAVLAGAISTAPTPALPKDTLLG